MSIEQQSKGKSIQPRVAEADFPAHGDERGMLVAVEASRDFDFIVKRVYYIYDTTEGFVRGKHAHHRLRQILICLSGSCIIDAEIEVGKKSSYLLDSPTKALFIDGLVWREMREFSPGAVLLVLADDIYREDDYIRDYDRFTRLACERQDSMSGNG